MSRRRRGIARLIEAILSTAIVVSALGLAYYYVVPANPNVVRGASDLDQSGFNLMNALAGQGGFDSLAFNSTTGLLTNDSQQSLAVAIGSVLPSGIAFNLTVYRAVVMTPPPPNMVDLMCVSTLNITNALPSSFLNAGETAQITYMYTTQHFVILVMQLQLARSTHI
jgi:hypothetical protein